MTFFSVNFIDMYRMDTVFSLIMLVSEMLKIPSAQVKAHFLKKLAFVTNKCQDKMPLEMFNGNIKPFK